MYLVLRRQSKQSNGAVGRCFGAGWLRDCVRGPPKSIWLVSFSLVTVSVMLTVPRSGNVIKVNAGTWKLLWAWSLWPCLFLFYV